MYFEAVKLLLSRVSDWENCDKYNYISNSSDLENCLTDAAVDSCICFIFNGTRAYVWMIINLTVLLVLNTSTKHWRNGWHKHYFYFLFSGVISVIWRLKCFSVATMWMLICCWTGTRLTRSWVTITVIKNQRINLVIKISSLYDICRWSKALFWVVR